MKSGPAGALTRWRQFRFALVVGLLVVSVAACEPHPGVDVPWKGRLLDGSYTLFLSTGDTPCYSPTGHIVLTGYTLKVKGPTATGTGPHGTTLTGSTARRANAFTLRLDRTNPADPAASLNLHGTVWGATDITGSGEFKIAAITGQPGSDCHFSFTARLTTSHPPCTHAAIQAAAGPGSIIDIFQCLGPWAFAGVYTNTAPAEYTALMHSKGNTWKVVPRHDPCLNGSIPPEIFLLACQSN